LQIRFEYLKLTSATPGLSNPYELRFKSNMAGIFATDIYRIVGDTVTFLFRRYFCFPDDICNCLRLLVYSRNLNFSYFGNCVTKAKISLYQLTL
jgi:hypothetical protein